MSRSFMVCVVNTIPGFLVYRIIEPGDFSEQHISVTLEFSSPLMMFITVDSDVTGQLVLSSFCLSLFTLCLHVQRRPRMFVRINIGALWSTVPWTRVRALLLLNCVFCCKKEKKKLKEMEEAFTDFEMMTS